ncbi:hypothetical protein B0J14DRAFT_637285 [Halenospora varia]|nr:hypothetical protein B0J14DRAFT_637285 [Halenospora varia]
MADIIRKVLVVIGIGGMGLSIARRLATLRSEGHTVEVHALDIVDYSAVCKLTQEAGNLGQIDAIIHTAGVAPGISSARQIFEIDLLGTANVIEAFLPVASPGTSLVCIASMAGNMIQLSSDLEKHLATAARDQLLQHKEIDLESSNPGMAYGMAKRGNQLRVQGAARAWGKKGARVNSVSPGVISTALAQRELEGPGGDHMRSMIELSAARRLGTPDDVANAVAFLAGSDSNFITGNDILVDGGTVSGRRWRDGN